MTDLKTIILAYIRNGVHVTRSDVLSAKLGRYMDVRKALAELNSEGRIWLMGDGTIEAAGKVAKL